MGLAARADVTQTAAGVATASAPAVVELPAIDVESQSLIEIRDRRSRQLITVIELLKSVEQAARAGSPAYSSNAARCSPVPRPGGNRPAPRRTADANGGFALVRLLRPREPGRTRPQAGVWPVGLRDPLPTIPIPLRDGDADLRLELQLLLNRIYDAARYEYYIYEGIPSPPLTADARFSGRAG